MVTPYVPEAGDIVMMDFDPQVGREQAKRRPALVLTDQRYNRASGLAVVCPLTSKRKPYPFALPITVGQVEGAVLVDQLKSMDWVGRKAKFHSKAEPGLVSKVRQYIAVLLALLRMTVLFCCCHAAPCTKSYRYAATIRHAGQHRSSVLHLPALPKASGKLWKGEKHGTEN
jgi:mRNA interferase MazF